MIGSLIGQGLQALGDVAAAFTKKQAYDEALKSNTAQQEKNAAFYLGRMNEDSTHRADAQRMLTMTQDAYRQRNRAAAASAAVTGASDESVAMEKEANAQAMSNTASQIAATGAARQDRMADRYMDNGLTLAQQRSNLGLQKGDLGFVNLIG